MTDREKAIVMAYTGVCMLMGDKFNIFHRYIEELMGRPVYTHELGFLEYEIREKAKEDFIKLCETSEQQPRNNLAESSQVRITLEEEIMKLDLIASDAFEGGDVNEFRQLAEWLKELKAYREAEKEIEQELVNWNDIDNGKCRGLFLATSIIQHYKDGEVNADENSD